MPNPKINVYLKQRPRQFGGGWNPFILASIEGFKRHGLKTKVLQTSECAGCDISVNWGIRNRNQVFSGERAMVFERGYMLDRLVWASCGWDGLNGYANFCNDESPSDRLDKYFQGLLKPWRGGYKGSYVLLIGQITGDSAIFHLDIEEVYTKITQEILDAGYNVVFRPHPLMARPANFIRRKAVKVLTGTLQDAFLGAKWVVTVNSNAGVDAILSGIPTVSIDEGSLAWGITGHKACEGPPMLDRHQWLCNLSYAQWIVEEISSGEWWDHLKSGY